jgi:hypothetical protein
VSLDELETAVMHLRAEELAAFARWFEEYLADAWDRRIEADIQAGRLDEAGRQADEDFEAGRCKPHFITSDLPTHGGNFIVRNSSPNRRSPRSGSTLGSNLT